MLMDYMETEQSYFFEWQPKIFKDLELHEPHETRILSLYYYPVYNISFKKKVKLPPNFPAVHWKQDDYTNINKTSLVLSPAPAGKLPGESVPGDLCRFALRRCPVFHFHHVCFCQLTPTKGGSTFCYLAYYHNPVNLKIYPELSMFFQNSYT